MFSRGLKEILVDRLLMLFTIAETMKMGGRISGKTKLLKMIYLSEERMNANKINGFSYRFYRWTHGPLSNESLEDLEWLEKNGLVKFYDYNISLEKRASELLGQCKELLERNEDVLKPILSVVREYYSYSGKNIKAAVYGFPKVGEKKVIGKIEKGEALLEPIDIERALKFFRIDDEWIETILINLSKELYTSLEEGIKDAKEGKVAPYQPLK